MLARRFEPRLLCARVVDVHWKTKGRNQHCTASLEDISTSGACLQVKRPIPLGAKICIRREAAELTGTIRYCCFRDVVYFLGIEFDEGCRWSPDGFHPLHLQHPRRWKPCGLAPADWVRQALLSRWARLLNYATRALSLSVTPV